MNSLACFDFDDVAIRVEVRDGEPWFYAVDVCRVLELENPSKACHGLDEDERMTLTNKEGHSGKRGGAQTFIAISESGLYTLIFKSRKPEAKRFRKWITSEVIPAIRKTGSYVEEPHIPRDEPSLSLFRYVQQHCSSWSMERQMEFGQMVRRFSKSMGVLFEVQRDEEFGRVFAFPHAVLDNVRKKFCQTVLLPDSDAVEFEKLLDAVLVGSPSGQIHPPEILRGIAKVMHLFPRVFQKDSTLASERSGFGKICHRFNGYIFPSGVQLVVMMSGRRGEAKYQINQYSQADAKRLVSQQ